MCHHGYRITADERELEELRVDIPEDDIEEVENRPEDVSIPAADD